MDDLQDLLDRFDIAPQAKDSLMAFVAVIRLKDPETYEHSLRVAKLGVEIAEVMHLDPKVLLFAGLLHDIGKVLSDLEVLRKKENFTQGDLKHVSLHVLDGYRMLRGLFDFTADVIVWHHEFQRNPYPATRPKPLHDYKMGTFILIPMYGRLLALADFYEAVHRPNDRYGPQNGKALREVVQNENADLQVLVSDLYRMGVFDERLGTAYEEM